MSSASQPPREVREDPELQRLQDALRVSEQRFRAIMQQSPLSTQILAPDGTTLAVNGAWERLWGASLGDLAGYNMLHDPQLEQQGVAPLLRRAFAGEAVRLPLIPYDPRRTMPELYDEGDSLRWVSAFAYPVKDEAGQVREVVLVHQDITEERRAAERLRASEERLRMALDAGRMNVWDWDLASDAVQCSENARAFWGVDVGRSADFMRAIHPDDVALVERAAREAIASGEEAYGCEYRLRADSGEVRWVQSRGRVERDADGVATRILGVTMDVTQQHQAEEATRLLADAGETLGASLDYRTTLSDLEQVLVPRLADWYAVDLLDESGRLERVCVTHPDPGREAPAGDLLARYPARRGNPYGAWAVLESGEPQWMEQVDDDVLTRAAQDEGHLQVLRALGVNSWLRVPLSTRGRAVGVLTLVYAGSGRRYRQGERDLAVELARRIASAVDNARLYHQRQAQDRRKDEFLATLAHELRNPLAPIRSGVSVLGSRPPDAVAARMLAIMDRQLGHMVQLIDDLLDVSRITRGTIELRRSAVALATVVESAVEASRPLLDASGLALALRLPDPSPWVEGDETRLAQVVTNLLNNAARFTPPGGRVELSVRCEAEDVLIEVADTGAGIAPDMLHAIFDLFVRAPEAGQQAPGGLGIGLTLVRRLVELHGGAVWAHSEGPGRGSRFCVRLPRLATELPAQGPAHPAVAGTAGSALRILVVDDNLDAAESLAALLELAGHVVRRAADARSALECAPAFDPDLALLDIGLPDMDGYALARRMRAQAAGRGLRLVALTGWGREEDREQAFAAGFDAHLTKPVDSDALLALVERLPADRPPRST